ncbi:hypothetical protein [Actinocorallia longicatena]|uniref:Uncharacterized protein n=1 Tax=Actinocorallia longicatena TaxID=111803 RepID=A0ABP6Q6C4_9ACTN
MALELFTPHDEPLDPLHHVYAPVDRSGEAYQDFCRQAGPLLAADARAMAKGHVVQITGGDLCGKTSLALRCAHWVETTAPANLMRVTKIDLTPLEGTAEESFGDRNLRLFEAVVDELVERLTPAEQTELASLVNPDTRDPERAYRRLVLLLSPHGEPPPLLVVVLPRIEVKGETECYLRFAVPGLMFITEATVGDPAADCVLRPGRERAVISLSVGTLDEDDGWAFICARVAGRDDLLREWESCKEHVDTYVRDRSSTGSGLSIGQFLKVMRMAHDIAIAESRSTLDMGDIGRAYARSGVNI